MAKLLKIAKTKDVPPGQAAAFTIEGQKIALFNVEGTYHAIGDTCTHRGGPLSEGDVQGTRVTCPWHGADFDLKTGAVLGPPAQKGVPSYNPRALVGQPETGAGQERRAEPVNLLFQNSIALAADRQRKVLPP